MNEIPLISIITPCYNSVSTISQTIQSVINQTFENWELIICDDGSSDNVGELVRDFNDSRIKYIDNKYDKGAAGARNTGIDISQGRYVCFLDSDDLWSDSKLEVQLKFMQDNGFAFTYGAYYIITNDINNIRGTFNPSPIVSLTDILKTCDIGCLTVMIDRNMVDNFYFPHCDKEDYALWICLMKLNDIVAYQYPGILAYYRISSNSVSSNKLKEIRKQYAVLKEFSNLSTYNILVNVLSYTFNGFVKHFFKYRMK